MIGLARENSLLFYYQLATLGILGLFSLYDFRHLRVPNKALLCFLPWCLLSLPLQESFPGPINLYTIMKAGMGFLGGGLLLYTAALVTHGGIGGGDIKLSALLGIICGTYGIYILLSTAALTALPFFLFRKALTGTPKERIPFVPFLFIGLILLWML